jgi:ParB-like chromosome segregation protein Spo0J
MESTPKGRDGTEMPTPENISPENYLAGITTTGTPLPPSLPTVYGLALEIYHRLRALSEEDRIEALLEIRERINDASPLRSQPIDNVRWVPIEKVTPNEYNPNSVAKIEMGLLYVSILHDGLTQPIVTVYNAETDLYEIVDGFHRYFTVKSNEDLRARTFGLLPIVVIDKSVAERMASTVRHNRARGKHSVTGMSNLVFRMLEEGRDDSEICNELGMSPEELLRLKHITGFSKLFENAEYRKAWATERQIRIAKQYKEDHPEDPHANGRAL